jgi:acetyl esterase
VTRPTPHPQAQAYLDAPTANLLELDLEGSRRESNRVTLENAGPGEEVAEVRDLDAGGVPARLYRPEGVDANALVFLHGGGWVFSDLDCYDSLCRALANRAGTSVVSVDYRLAPEHRFPAAIDDCWTATEWAAGHFDRIAVGGDSAGGNLAAAVALRARDRGLPLAFQLLVYPVLDWGSVEGEGFRTWAARYAGFGGRADYGDYYRDGNRWIWQEYVPDEAQRLVPDASPARASSFAGLAPGLMILAEHDILSAEGEDYARALEAAGVAMPVVTYPGNIHGFFHLLGRFDDAHDAVDRSAAALRAAF